MNSETNFGNGDLGDWQDPAFDSLLAEAIGGPQPPDLSERVMFALKKTNEAAEQATQVSDSGRYRVVDPVVSQTVPSAAVVHRSHWPLLIGMVSLAASIAVAILYFPDSAENGGGGNPAVVVAGRDESKTATRFDSDNKPVEILSSPNIETDSSEPDPSQQNGGGNRPRRPAQPIELESPNFADLNDGKLLQDSAPAALPVFAEPGKRLSDVAIVSMIDSGLSDAWASEGIEPAQEVKTEEVGRRLAELLGTDVQFGEGEVLASLKDVIGKEQVQATLTSRLAATMLGRTGVRRIKKEQFVAFVEFLKPAFGETRFDRLAGEMLTARGAVEPGADGFNPAAVWLGALAGPQSIPLAEQAGHALLDVDLRCSRCHDHPLDGRVWQDQYWQFSAMFDTGLRWLVGDDGVLRVQSPEAADKQNVIFYERSDGRQRAATPKAPLVWIAGEAESETQMEYGAASGAAELERLAAAMRNNPQLAKAAVNRVWESVYGRSLVGSAADPAAPPETIAMVRLQAELAEQFRAHEFDMAKLFTWVLASKPMRLAIPRAWESPVYESASGAELAAAAEQLRAFASFPAVPPKRRFNDLLARVNIRDRGLIDSLDAASNFPGGLLAQFQSSEQAKNNGDGDKRLSAASQDQLLDASLEAMEYAGEKLDGATQASPLPADWLEKVGGPDPFQRRAEHLYYLAGYWHPSPQQLQVARALRAQGQDDAAALRRLWWVLNNEGF